MLNFVCFFFKTLSLKTSSFENYYLYTCISYQSVMKVNREDMTSSQTYENNTYTGITKNFVTMVHNYPFEHFKYQQFIC